MSQNDDKQDKRVLRLSTEAQQKLAAEAARRGVTQGDLLSALIREHIPQQTDEAER